MTTEENLKLCNDINTAIAKGWTVMASNADDKYTIEGAIIYKDSVTVLTFGSRHKFSFNQRIYAVKRVEVEVDTIYEPVAAKTAASNPDLSNSSP
jgi:hypothetical protein